LFLANLFKLIQVSSGLAVFNLTRLTVDLTCHDFKPALGCQHFKFVSY